ncbi:MAG: glucose 1-dehydrogenase [Deltaproteobacteria bacterium]|nr:MAG: glucose 1-dehydrogenase [Deltaproteobacteria bacterium]
MPMADVTWDFTGKVALASGGASGIGRAAATAWLAAGARVAILDQSAERLEETTGALGADRLLAISGDVSEPADCDRAIDETVRRFGRLDVVLNAAGIGGIGRVWELDPLIWDRVLAVNLRGTFLLTRAATRWMVEHERPGRVINIASTNATVPTTGHSPYCASKAGVVALTQVAALELAPRQVTVNAIAPGPVDTNLTAPLFAMAGAREEFLRHIPLGRVGRAEDIAQMILFLASDAAEWVTGQCFYVEQKMVRRPFVRCPDACRGCRVVATRRGGGRHGGAQTRDDGCAPDPGHRHDATGRRGPAAERRVHPDRRPAVGHDRQEALGRRHHSRHAEGAEPAREKELYNLDRDAFELTNVAGNSANAGLIALMAARLRELDPGWTGSAPSAPASAAPPDYANDDAFE